MITIEEVTDGIRLSSEAKLASICGASACIHAACIKIKLRRSMNARPRTCQAAGSGRDVTAIRPRSGSCLLQL